ncbi:MAG: hypothetical protein Q4F17_10900 [Eubacteriales bacterium]|nr:hypothetical protein [Eubacteriales bacterium]
MQELEEILSRQVSGFHRYCLEPLGLCYVSDNLCGLLKTTREALLDGAGYEGFVHPGDRERYRAFLETLARERRGGTIQYRLLRSDGQVLSVSDTLCVDGAMAGSVLSDISEMRDELGQLRFLSDTVPCGFLKYTCEKQPRITYINDRMLSMLGFPQERDEREELLEFYRGNLYALVPMEERRRMQQYLDRVQRGGGPLAGEVTALRCDGTKAHLFGWVTRAVDSRGEAEFQSVCMDVSQRYQSRKAAEIDRYLSALHEVYDKIFQYDFSASTVTCLYGRNSPMFRHLERIPMQMQEVTDRWVRDTVLPEDQQAVLDFFHAAFQRRQRAGLPQQLRYRARSSDGSWKRYMGIFLEIDSAVSLFCCRNLTASREADLKSENDSLKNINENMQELMMHFTDGIAAFEIDGDLVTPLYASDNVCGFFGFTRAEWMELMKQKTPTAQFVRRSRIPYEELAKILTQGEAEFTYSDLSTGLTRRIKAICSKRSQGSEPRYVMLYDLDAAPREEGPKVYIRTFGYFDVFVDDKPIAFRIQKAKELFALLTDRRGGYVTSDEAISYLWPEEPSSPVTLARYRKVALRLKSILEEYGIPQVVEVVDGKRRLATDLVRCDLYDYLSGRPEYAQLFKGSYLTNYSWSETTLGGLTGDNLIG